MSRFGIRKKLKSALKKTILGDAGEPASPPSSRSASSEVASAASAASESVAPPPPPAPKPAPKMSPAPTPPPKTASPEAPKAEPDRSLGTSWIQAAGVKPDEVVPSTVHAVQVLGKRYALYKTEEGDFFATSDSCPHAGGPLAEGELDGFEVSCPFHSWTFDIRDGSCTSGQDMGVDCVPVKLTDDMVMLEVPL